MPKPKKQPLQPLGDRILVQAPPREKPSDDKMVHGIIIPAASQASIADTRHIVVKALAVGETCKVVKPGNYIVVQLRELFVVPLNGADHTMIFEGRVVGIVP